MALVVTASQIHQWAVSDREAQACLPILIRRLITESLSPEAIDRKDFSSDVGRHGFDGTLVTQRSHPYIPMGKSAWEMSVSAKTKPTTDFNKRIQQAEDDTTFIFVTARNWPGKDKWLAGKQNGAWDEVRAYDASDLEQWLESSPSTTLWLSEQIGLPQYHIQSPQTFLEDWLDEINSAFRQNLILQNRDEAKSKVLNFVAQASHNNNLTIFADTSDEALAFICAALDPTMSFRSLVITSEQGIDELLPWQKNFDQPYILIVRTSDLSSKIPSNMIGHNFLIIAEARGAVSFNPTDGGYYFLPRVGNFHALDKSIEKIHVFEKTTGGSLSALHRQLNRNPGKKRPHWAELYKGNRNFIWLALIGGWDERHDADKEIICELSGVASFDDWQEFADSLLEGEDAPLSRTCEDKPQYKLFSRIDAFLTISQKIRGHEIDRLFKKIQRVYLENDPNYRLPDKEGLYFHETRKYSDALRRGIMDGLAILACYSERDDLEYGNVAAKITELFRDMFVDENSWVRLRDLLPELAEVGPRNFIFQLQKTLKESPEKIADLFTPRRCLVWENNYLHPPLLWALESLAWNPDNLFLVLKLLCQLQRNYEGDIKFNFMNRPSESMSNILRSWMPQTSATIDQRIKALRDAYSAYPNEVVKLALSLAEQDSTGSILTRVPIWRDNVLAKQETTHGDHLAMVMQAIDLIINYLQNEDNLLTDRVEIASQAMNNFQWWGIEKSREVADAICTIPTSDDTHNRKLFDWTRERIRWCSPQSKGDRDAQKIVGLYEKLHSYFEPRDLIERYAHLFDASTRTEFYYIDGSRKKSRNMANNAHGKALSEIYKENGIVGLIALLRRVEAADIVAVNLYASHIVDGKFPDIDEYLVALLNSDLGIQVKRYHLFFLFYGAYPSEPMDASVTIAFIKPVLKRVTDVTKQALLLQAIRIDQREGRDFIDKQPSDVQKEVFSYKWIQRGFCELRPKGNIIPPESAWLVEHYLRYKRPRLTLASFIAPDYIPADKQLKILDAIFISNRDVGGDKDPMPESYCIERMFEILAKQYADTDNDTLARLAVVEMKFHNFLNQSEYSKSSGFILRYLANCPTYFIDLHKYVYKDEEGNIADMNMPEVDAEVYASVAFQVFSNLNLRYSSHIPWVSENQALDTTKLRSWINKVRKLAKEAKMSQIVDQHIGAGLSHSRLSCDDVRPEYAICDIIKDNGSPNMYEGFRIGRYNSRGVLTADTDSAGLSSTDLALAYSSAADKLRDNYSDMAKIFDELSDSYQRDATHWRIETERMDINSR